MTDAPATPALRQLVGELPARFPPERVDRVWLFAPREVNGRESGLVVLSLFSPAGAEGDQRQLLTIRYEATPTRAGGVQLSQETVEQGWVPAERIPRLITGVLVRLRDQAEDEPLGEEIAGDPDRWAALLSRLSPAA